jgi:Flp pilus assembly pilin Flp
MRRLLRKLWNDEAGFVVSAELVLVATLLVIGMVVGLTSLRNQVVQELADLGAAIGMISQGYQYTGTSKITDEAFAYTDGSGWDDLTDECQTDTGADVDNEEPAQISVTLPPPLLPDVVPGED